MSTIPSKVPSRSNATLWAWISTALWTSAFLFVSYHSNSCETVLPGSWWSSHVACLRLNELGDLAAGMFSPLAFIWFLTAVFLQRNELELTRNEFIENRATAERAGEQFTLQTSHLKEANAVALQNLKMSYSLSVLDHWVQIYSDIEAIQGRKVSRDWATQAIGLLDRVRKTAAMLNDYFIADWAADFSGTARDWLAAIERINLEQGRMELGGVERPDRSALDSAIKAAEHVELRLLSFAHDDNILPKIAREHLAPPA